MWSPGCGNSSTPTSSRRPRLAGTGCGTRCSRTPSRHVAASQRAALHAAVAGVLAARGGESPAEIAAHWARAGDRVEEARWSVEAAGHAEGCTPGGRPASPGGASGSCGRPAGERATRVELPEVVVRCVRAARVNLAMTRHASLSLVRAALADGGSRRRQRDRSAADRLRQPAQSHRRASRRRGAATGRGPFDRAGRPSADQARALAASSRRRKSKAPPPAARRPSWPAPADIADQVRSTWRWSASPPKACQLAARDGGREALRPENGAVDGPSTAGPVRRTLGVARSSPMRTCGSFGFATVSSGSSGHPAGRCAHGFRESTASRSW